MATISELVGCTIINVEGCTQGSDEVVFTLADGRRCKFLHHQSCCENVEVEDVVGDVNDLIGCPVLSAAEVCPEGLPPVPGETGGWTWTFYDIATKRGAVTIRWYGNSNGYYSEEVDFEWMQDPAGDKHD